MRWLVLLTAACAAGPRPTRVSLAISDQVGMQVSALRVTESALASELLRAGLQPSTTPGEYLVTGVAVSQARRGHTCMVQLAVQVKEVATARIVGTPSVTEPGGGRDEQACATDGAKRAAASIAPRLVELMQKQKP